MSPAMKYRNSLNFGAEFDSRRSEIMVFKDWMSGKFVVTVLPKLTGDDPDNTQCTYNGAFAVKAKSLWHEKYAQEMPEHVDGQWAETCFADAIPYVGTVLLTQEETEVLKNAKSFGDFTLDMLWLIVEGLGWRPGKPVSEEDPGWLAIWAEDEECASYYEIVRSVLAMPHFHNTGSNAVMLASAGKAHNVHSM